MPFLETQGAKLFYLQSGAGPDVLWVPGGDNVAADWADQFKAFDRDFRNISLDPRGAGQTISHRPPPWTMADYAVDCAALIRACCRPPVFVVGLSMGSLIALQLALDFPELVRAAVPMGTAAKATGFTRDWMIAEVEFRRAGGRLTRDFAVCHYGAFMYPSEVLGDEQTVAEGETLRRSELWAARGRGSFGPMAGLYRFRRGRQAARLSGTDPCHRVSPRICRPRPSMAGARLPWRRKGSFICWKDWGISPWPCIGQIP